MRFEKMTAFKSQAEALRSKPHPVRSFSIFVFPVHRYAAFEKKAELKARAEALRARMRESHLAGFREEVKQRCARWLVGFRVSDLPLLSASAPAATHFCHDHKELHLPRLLATQTLPAWPPDRTAISRTKLRGAAGG